MRRRLRLRRSRRAQRWALGIVLLLLGAAAFSLFRAYRSVLAYPDRPVVVAGGETTVTIPRGTSLSGTIAHLVEAGVLPERDARYFRLYVLHRGAAGKITAGAHRFTPDMTAKDLLDELTRRPKAPSVRVTIPEGRNMLEVAALLERAGFGDKNTFEAAMRDPKLAARLGVPADTLEGYLFPDTYRFRRGADPEAILARMVERHRQVYAELVRRHRKGRKALERDLGFDDHAIVTLASIVEKETGAAHERPIIAGVFLNRLRMKIFQPKLLQTDPTIIYGCTVPVRKSRACKTFEGRIRRIHLNDTDNPYNTYRHEGLPPGPISNPGRAALEAVLAPKKTRFLYFVSRNDGTHQFSRTRAEHERYVDLYQRKNAVGDGSADGAKDP